ncbi:hypothetical protein CMI37_24100 [Candidatus Pacearchaeota archaeon]|nr:hypothetical protein [Candidatus Pacearchaeota archaeon]
MPFNMLQETPSGGAGSSEHAGVDDQSSSNDDQITIKDTEVVINEDGDDLDFRVEASGEANALVVQGSDGYVGLGTDAPTQILHVFEGSCGAATDASTHAVIESDGASFLGIYGGTTQDCGIRFGNGVLQGKIAYSNNGDAMKFYTNGSNERLQIDSSGNVGINTTSPDSLLEVSKAAGDAEVLVSCYHDTKATTPKITFRKADNTEASPALVDDDAVLGTIDFLGHDGTNFERGAKIEARVQGTSANNDLPTELTFWTTPDGSNTAAERMSIGADGAVALKSLAAVPTVATGYSKLFAKSEVGLDNAILMHFEGSDAATSGAGFADSGGFGLSNASRTGAEVDTAQYKFGSSSMLFDRSAGDFLDANGGSHDSSFDLGYGDFTIDFWVKFQTLDNGVSGRRLLSSATHNDAGSFRILYDSTQKWSFTYGSGGTGVLTASADTGIAAAVDGSSAWYHVAYVRTGNTVLMFRDGTLKGYGPLTTAVTWPGGMNIGNSWNTELTLGHDGWMDELRIVKRAVWLNNFTPPTQPYGDSTMQVIDGQGNVTRLSPHNAQGEWEYFSQNSLTGKTVRINMEEVVSDLGKLTGKNYIKDE